MNVAVIGAGYVGLVNAAGFVAHNILLRAKSVTTEEVDA